MGELIPVPSVEGPNDAHPVLVSDKPEAGIEIRCKGRAGQQPLDAFKEGPMIEHDVLLAVEPLVKVDTLHSLWHVALLDSVGKGTHVSKLDSARSESTVARPLQHVIPFYPRHIAAHIGPIDLTLLPAKWAWFPVVPVQGGDLVGCIIKA